MTAHFLNRNCPNTASIDQSSIQPQQNLQRITWQSPALMARCAHVADLATRNQAGYLSKGYPAAPGPSAKSCSNPQFVGP